MMEALNADGMTTDIQRASTFLSQALHVLNFEVANAGIHWQSGLVRARQVYWTRGEVVLDQPLQGQVVERALRRCTPTQRCTTYALKHRSLHATAVLSSGTHSLLHATLQQCLQCCIPLRQLQAAEIFSMPHPSHKDSTAL